MYAGGEDKNRASVFEEYPWQNYCKLISFKSYLFILIKLEN